MSDVESPVRLALIGTGGIANMHAEHIQSHPKSKLVGGVDVSTEARERFSETYDVPTFETYDDLQEYGVDGVIITTPNAFHAEYAINALNDDVHVLCEKPLSDTLDGARDVLNASKQSNAVCLVGFNNRFVSPVKRVIHERDAGRFGDIVHVDANWIRRRGIPGRGGWFTRKNLSGGGAMIDLGVHVLDLSLYLLGNPTVVEVSATARSLFGGRDDYTYAHMYGTDHGSTNFDVDDSVTAFIRCDSGQTIALDVAWATNRPDDSSLTVTGVDSGASFDIKENNVTFYDVDRTEDAEDVLPTLTEETEGEEGHYAELSYYIKAIEGKEQPPMNTIEEAYHVQEVIAAIYKSSETQSSVKLAESERSLCLNQ